MEKKVLTLRDMEGMLTPAAQVFGEQAQEWVQDTARRLLEATPDLAVGDGYRPELRLGPVNPETNTVTVELHAVPISERKASDG